MDGFNSVNIRQVNTVNNILPSRRVVYGPCQGSRGDHRG
jgi:hypothetical protein